MSSLLKTPSINKRILTKNPQTRLHDKNSTNSIVTFEHGVLEYNEGSAEESGFNETDGIYLKSQKKLSEALKSKPDITLHQKLYISFFAVLICIPNAYPTREQISQAYIYVIRIYYPYYKVYSAILVCLMVALGLLFYLADVYKTKFKYFTIWCLFSLGVLYNLNLSSVLYYKMSVILNMLYVFYLYFLKTFFLQQYSDESVNRFIYLLSTCTSAVIIVYYGLMQILFNDVVMSQPSFATVCSELKANLDWADYQHFAYYSMDMNCHMLFLVIIYGPYLYCINLLLIATIMYKISAVDEHGPIELADDNLTKIRKMYHKFKIVILSYAIAVFFFYLVLNVGSVYIVEMNYAIMYMRDTLLIITLLYLIVFYETYQISISLIELEQTELFRLFQNYFENDFTRACVLLVVGMALPVIYAAILFKRRFCKGKYRRKQDPFAVWMLNGSLNRILNYIVLIDIFVVLVMRYGSHLLEATLAWFSNYLLTLSILEILVIYYVFGLVIFVIPLEPKLPIYMIGGLIFGPYMHRWDRSGQYWLFMLGVWIASLEAMLIKLSSQVIIQWMSKYIGHNLWVSMHVGMHKPFMKAIGDIFNNPDYCCLQGLCFIAIPDMPMSIYTGLADLPYRTCLRSCLFVYVLCFSFCLSGACLAMHGNVFEKLSTVLITLALLLQTYLIYYASAQVQQYITENEAYYSDPANYTPKELELVALERQEALEHQQQHLASNLCNMNSFDIAMLITTTILFTICIVGTIFLDTYFFRQATVTTDIYKPISEHGLNGDIMEVVTPLGWGLFFVFLFALLLYIIQKIKENEYLRLYSFSKETRDGTNFIIAHRVAEQPYSLLDRILNVPDVDVRIIETVELTTVVRKTQLIIKLQDSYDSSKKHSLTSNLVHSVHKNITKDFHNYEYMDTIETQCKD